MVAAAWIRYGSEALHYALRLSVRLLFALPFASPAVLELNRHRQARWAGRIWTIVNTIAFPCALQGYRAEEWHYGRGHSGGTRGVLAGYSGTLPVAHAGCPRRDRCGAADHTSHPVASRALCSGQCTFKGGLGSFKAVRVPTCARAMCGAGAGAGRTRRSVLPQFIAAIRHAVQARARRACPPLSARGSGAPNPPWQATVEVQKPGSGPHRCAAALQPSCFHAPETLVRSLRARSAHWQSAALIDSCRRRYE